MKYKNLLLLPTLFILSNVLYIGCCKCPEITQQFYSILNANVTASGSGNKIIDTGAVTQVDSVFLKYNFTNNCVARVENPLTFLVNTAYALKCDCDVCGAMGLKNKISSIDITSDSVYNGIAANTSIKQFFKNRFYDYQTASYSNISLDSLKAVINANKEGALYTKEIFTTTKPANSKGHIFKLTIKFEGGKEIAVGTRRIYWN
jgi:adenine-specific DNA methylase